MVARADAAPIDRPHKKIYEHLYFQVLVAIFLGALLGYFYPALGESMKPLGDIFIKLVRMLIAPIIFCTVVHGIASSDDAKKVGRVGVKAIVYFEVVTTIALGLGLVAMNVLQPGAGMNIDPATLDTKGIQSATQAHPEGVVDYLMHIVPDTVVGALARGEILQVLFFSVLFAFGVQRLGALGKPLVDMIDIGAHGLFSAIGIIMKVAPIGAFGAMAFTIGKYGIATMIVLGKLLVVFYGTCLLFVFGVLGLICYLTGFSLWKFLRYIKEELLIVLGTSSSESALPRLMAKLELLGCENSVVGLVVPAGYTFNLDGTCIMLTTMALFIAQATNVDISLWQQIGLLGLLLLTSKGAASVTGGAFVVLAATLSSFGMIPLSGMALVLGVYRFLSEAGSIINMIGNGIATIVVARWEGAIDMQRLRQHLDQRLSSKLTNQKRRWWPKFELPAREVRPRPSAGNEGVAAPHVALLTEPGLFKRASNREFKRPGRPVAARRGRPVDAAAGCERTMNKSPDFPRIKRGFVFRSGRICRCSRLPALKPLAFNVVLERAKGFEPSTPTLARLCSTPELQPHLSGLRSGSRWSDQAIRPGIKDLMRRPRTHRPALGCLDQLSTREPGRDRRLITARSFQPGTMPSRSFRRSPIGPVSGRTSTGHNPARRGLIASGDESDSVFRWEAAVANQTGFLAFRRPPVRLN